MSKVEGDEVVGRWKRRGSCCREDGGVVARGRFERMELFLMQQKTSARLPFAAENFARGVRLLTLRLHERET